jgi:hypothetical protein
VKSSFLARLQRTAISSLIGSIMLLLVVPILQLALLDSQGYNIALATPRTELLWIQGHTAIFLLYSLVLILSFALLIGMPFALFRIIIAQETVGRADLEEQEKLAEDALAEIEQPDVEEESETGSESPTLEKTDGQNAMSGDAWKGKGFVVSAAWTGLVGLALVAFGLLASTIYLWSSSSIISIHTPLPGNFASVSSIFAILTYTLGDGGIGLSCIFFGVSIARSGRRLWPDSWVAFGYLAIAEGALTGGSAVQIALNTSNQTQATLTTPAILLFAIWSLWFSLMVIRLRPE